MNAILAFLEGKKTYITAVIAILVVTGQVLAHQLTWQTGVADIIGSTSLLAAFLRSGQKADAVKAAELAAAKVTVALAPILTQAAPGLALTAEEIAQAIISANAAKMENQS